MQDYPAGGVRRCGLRKGRCPTLEIKWRCSGLVLGEGRWGRGEGAVFLSSSDSGPEIEHTSKGKELVQYLPRAAALLLLPPSGPLSFERRHEV